MTKLVRPIYCKLQIFLEKLTFSSPIGLGDVNSSANSLAASSKIPRYSNGCLYILSAKNSFLNDKSCKLTSKQ